MWSHLQSEGSRCDAGGQATLVATEVVNITLGERADVFIGRPSKWSNPFTVSIHGRVRAVRLYAHMLDDLHPDGVFDIAAAARQELRGKRLGCYCAPLLCHGHVLALVADGEDPIEAFKIAVELYKEPSF